MYPFPYSPPALPNSQTRAMAAKPLVALLDYFGSEEDQANSHRHLTWTISSRAKSNDTVCSFEVRLGDDYVGTLTGVHVKHRRFVPKAEKELEGDVSWGVPVSELARIFMPNEPTSALNNRLRSNKSLWNRSTVKMGDKNRLDTLSSEFKIGRGRGTPIACVYLTKLEAILRCLATRVRSWKPKRRRKELDILTGGQRGENGEEVKGETEGEDEDGGEGKGDGEDEDEDEEAKTLVSPVKPKTVVPEERTPVLGKRVRFPVKRDAEDLIGAVSVREKKRPRTSSSKSAKETGDGSETQKMGAAATAALALKKPRKLGKRAKAAAKAAAALAKAKEKEKEAKAKARARAKEKAAKAKAKEKEKEKAAKARAKAKEKAAKEKAKAKAKAKLEAEKLAKITSLAKQTKKPKVAVKPVDLVDVVIDLSTISMEMPKWPVCLPL